MTWWKWAVLGTALGWVVLACTAMWWAPALVAYGPSTSLPKGWYIRAWRQNPVLVGDLVVLTPPQEMRSYLPPTVPQARILKQVVAVGGMVVCWTEAAMVIYGEESVASFEYHPEAPAVRYRRGCRVVEPDELVVSGTAPRSFDSRYIGPLCLSAVQWRAVPLYTWRTP
jgi:type IV secretory pathway protease TraF